jgi:hypothetical protein
MSSIQAPKSWAERAYPKLIHYNKLDKGRALRGLGTAEALCRRVRAGFRSLRTSFTKPIVPSNIRELPDPTHGVTGIEVRSIHGDSHLGHVFDDGPTDRGGLRYCINSASLRFIHRDDMVAEGYEGYLNQVEDIR